MVWRSLQEKRLVRTVQRHWLSVAFVLGFITDLILLNQVDSLMDNVILLFYVLLATFSLLGFYLGVAERLPERTSRFFERYMPVVMQYSFGGLLSGMLIFYGRSGDLFASAPFYLLLIAVVFGNEVINKRSNRLIFHLVLFFVGILAYFVLVVPVVTGEMGDVVFVGSGLLAVVVMVALVKLLVRIIPHFMTLQMRAITFTLGSVYVLFNLFYFFNLIPPIPLSLTQLAIYHDVERTPAGAYRVVAEERPWWQAIPFVPRVVHPLPGGKMACFARVYAPTSLSTDIYHRWQYYDEATGRWREHFRTSYRISGENKNGYGGYTEIRSFSDGRWRCTVETARGQVLGRYRFTIDTGTPSGELVTRLE